MGLQQFRKYLCRYGEVQQKGVEGLLRLLEKDRMGEQVDRMCLKSLLRMLCDLRIYGDVFEAQFLDATEHFYKTEGSERLVELSTAEYLRHAEGRLGSESERVANYLDAGSTRKPLITIVEDRLLRDVSQNHEFYIKTHEFCIKTHEFCIKNKRNCASKPRNCVSKPKNCVSNP